MDANQWRSAELTDEDERTSCVGSWVSLPKITSGRRHEAGNQVVVILNPLQQLERPGPKACLWPDRRVPKSHMAYYNRSRTHLLLNKDSPVPRLVSSVSSGRIVPFPKLAGCITDTIELPPENQRMPWNLRFEKGHDQKRAARG